MWVHVYPYEYLGRVPDPGIKYPHERKVSKAGTVPTHLLRVPRVRLSEI